MTGSPKLERLFLLYNCKCFLSEEIIFQGYERQSKSRKQDISKTLFSRKVEYITPHLWEPIQGAITGCITIVPLASDVMKERFHEGLHGTKEAVFTVEIERQRPGIVGFISSHPGTLPQDNSTIFCSVFTIKASFQVMPSGTLLQYPKHKNHHFSWWEVCYGKKLQKLCSPWFWDGKGFEFTLLKYIFSNNIK